MAGEAENVSLGITVSNVAIDFVPAKHQGGNDEDHTLYVRRGRHVEKDERAEAHQLRAVFGVHRGSARSRSGSAFTASTSSRSTSSCLPSAR